MSRATPALRHPLVTAALIAGVIALMIPTVLAVMQVGFFGIFASITDSWASVQIFVDLFIVCVLAIVWMVIDARARGRIVWPWVVVTLIAGGFGPLGYLLVGQFRPSAPQSPID